MAYVDGFVIPISTKHLAAYRRLARAAGKVWRKHGAIAYMECVGDDLVHKGILPFTKLARTKRGETVLFSWITYRNKAHRNKVNAAVMSDPRIVKMMQEPMLFDPKRMAYGGFKSIVEL